MTTLCCGSSIRFVSASHKSAFKFDSINTRRDTPSSSRRRSRSKKLTPRLCVCVFGLFWGRRLWPVIAFLSSLRVLAPDFRTEVEALVWSQWLKCYFCWYYWLRVNKATSREFQPRAGFLSEPCWKGGKSRMYFRGQKELFQHGHRFLGMNVNLHA